LRRWFAAYALWLAMAGGVLAAGVHGSGWSWSDWRQQPVQAFTEISPAIKLVAFALYLSLCCTFLPLPTGWIVAALATREAAVTGDLVSTVLVVALAGALGSTLANLNDYHIVTALLRHHRIAAVRHTRTYLAASRWFAKEPFTILTIFNILPVPVDVVRLLAATSRYSRSAFAAANFLGRFLRYAAIAFVTYYWNLGWIAPAALLALAALLAIARLLGNLVRKRASDDSRIGAGE
jgi:membrane protein YqaA with SNARE-associated domain